MILRSFFGFCLNFILIFGLNLVLFTLVYNLLDVYLIRSQAELAQFSLILEDGLDSEELTRIEQTIHTIEFIDVNSVQYISKIDVKESLVEDELLDTLLFADAELYSLPHYFDFNAAKMNNDQYQFAKQKLENTSGVTELIGKPYLESDLDENWKLLSWGILFFLVLLLLYLWLYPINSFSRSLLMQQKISITSIYSYGKYLFLMNALLCIGIFVFLHYNFSLDLILNGVDLSFGILILILLMNLIYWLIFKAKAQKIVNNLKNG